MGMSAKPVELACGHVLWFTQTPVSEDETLWCLRCGMYREIQQTTAALGIVWTYWPDWDFKSKKRRNSNVYDGKCTFIDANDVECIHEVKAAFTFRALRERMHIHYMKMHTPSGGVEIEYAERYPKGSNPPF